MRQTGNPELRSSGQGLTHSLPAGYMVKLGLRQCWIDLYYIAYTRLSRQRSAPPERLSRAGVASVAGMERVGPPSLQAGKHAVSGQPPRPYRADPPGGIGS